MNALESATEEGDGPVARNEPAILSRSGLVKPGLKMGGPPSKAKYSSTTDSESVR